MMFWGSVPKRSASAHPIGAHLFHWALQHLSGRDVAKEGGHCLANMELTLEKITGGRCLDSLPMTKGRDGNNIFQEREVLLPSYSAHFYPFTHLLFP